MVPPAKDNAALPRARSPGPESHNGSAPASASGPAPAPARSKLRTSATGGSAASASSAAVSVVRRASTGCSAGPAPAPAAAPGPKAPAAHAGTGAGAGGGGAGPPYRHQVLPGNESVLMVEALKRRPWWRPVAGPGERWDLWFGCNGQKFGDFSALLPLSGAGGRPRAANRLDNHRQICTKSGLAELLAALQAALPGGAAAAPWIPETYCLPAGAGLGARSGALAAFRAAYARHAAEGARTWIAKPTSLNRGNGIEVFASLEQVEAHVSKAKPGTSVIVQKYIEHPMLLAGRKFDLRAYALVDAGPPSAAASPHSSALGLGRVWFHREAYVRTSATRYDLQDLSNRSAHLTNDAVQKTLDSYNAFEDHCKLSLEELGAALARGGSAAATPLDTRPGAEGGLWGAMRACVAALFSAALPRLSSGRHGGRCFELLGLDFMLDERGQMYLIEVNTSPALFRAGAYLADLLPRVVEEMVQKVIDPLFPPPQAAAATVAKAADAEGPAGAGEGDGGGGDAAAGRLLDGFVELELDGEIAKAVAARLGRVGGGRQAAARSPARGSANQL